jgi:hypothetical protein
MVASRTAEGIAPLEDFAVDIAIQIPDFLDKSGILHERGNDPTFPTL